MHYCSYAFTKNGQMTIVPKWMLIKIRCIASGGANCFISRRVKRIPTLQDPHATIGQHKDLSQTDLKKLLKMYTCIPYTVQ
ncbi:hypothetical protein E2C01_085929 [Portunus trituberculatus]|uniref:Peptidase M12A domain-containing protein n=1 Tax=Portunus trituberculatus TaxID=210409 RepID=A0A5B7J8B8_PORTR|nr:hypothetical protein [Portunus trituberculatus]